MPQPLNYFNPKGSDPPKKARRMPAVQRSDCDVLLTETADHPAARAIEVELERAKIPVSRTEADGPAERVIRLHIRAADRERASQIAAGIFVRRKRFKSFPRPEMPKDSSSGSIGLIFPDF